MRISPRSRSLSAFEAVPTLEAEIRQYQKDDEKLQEIRELLKKGKAPHFREDDQGTLWYKNRICVPDVKDLWKLILSEAMIQLTLFIRAAQRCIMI